MNTTSEERVDFGHDARLVLRWFWRIPIPVVACMDDVFLTFHPSLVFFLAAISACMDLVTMVLPDIAYTRYCFV